MLTEIRKNAAYRCTTWRADVRRGSEEEVEGGGEVGLRRQQRCAHEKAHARTHSHSHTHCPHADAHTHARTHSEADLIFEFFVLISGITWYLRRTSPARLVFAQRSRQRRHPRDSRSSQSASSARAANARRKAEPNFWRLAPAPKAVTRKAKKASPSKSRRSFHWRATTLTSKIYDDDVLTIVLL